MKEFEREEANIDELEQIGEFKNFLEEDYQCNELLNDGLEEFKVKEIQPQSFVENEHKNIKKEKNKDPDELRRKLNNQLKTSINTSATTTSAVTVVTVTAAVSVGMVTFPFNDYGKLEFLNYRVDTRVVYDVENNQKIKYKDIEIYFEEELKDNYKCNVLNLDTQEILELDIQKDFVKFTNLELDEYKFEVQVLDDNSHIIEKFDIDINTICEYEYLEETAYEYSITYNEDNTSNLYLDLNMIYEDESIINNIELVNDDEEVLDYNIKNEDNILIVEDIKEEKFTIITTSYYKKEGNYYLINKNLINDFMPNKLLYELDANLDKLTLSIHNEAKENLEIYIKYLDDNSIEKYTISKNNLNESEEIILDLSKISNELEVTLSGEFIMYDGIDSFNNYKGVFTKKVYETKVIKPKLDNNLELERIEILRNQYDSSLVTALYFNGYLLNDNYYDVNVYDSLGNLINSQRNISSFNEAIVFNELDQTQVLTFEYILKDNIGNEIYKNQYKTSINIPSEYLSIDYTFYQINPNEVYISYNDNQTYNIYIPAEFENRSEYDVYYKVTFTDTTNEEVYEVIGNDRSPYLLNCEPFNYYGLGYNVFVKKDIVYYSISYDVTVSGTISVSYDDNGYVEGFNYFDYEILEDKKYIFNIPAKVYSDIDIQMIIDGNEVINLKIPFNEIKYENMYSKVEIDLTNYQYEYADLSFVGIMNEHISFDERIDKNNIEGQEGALYIYNISI